MYKMNRDPQGRTIIGVVVNVWGNDSCETKEPCIRCGRDPHRKRQLLVVVRNTEKH